jgi:glycerol-3-phosphate dehydrogenase
MAEDTVNEAVKLFDLKPQAISMPDISGANASGFTTSGLCCTRNIPLIGAHGYSTSLASQLMEMYPIDADVADHLAHNYGDRAWTVLSTNPSLNKRLVSGLPYLEAEVAHGIRNEAACTVADIIARRTRLSFLDSSKALQALPRVIDIAATELQWSKARKAQEKADSIAFLASMGLEQKTDAPVQASQEERMPARQIEHSQQRPARVGGLDVDLNGLGSTSSYSKSRDD